jgi:hypothetical protein
MDGTNGSAARSDALMPFAGWANTLIAANCCWNNPRLMNATAN